MPKGEIKPKEDEEEIVDQMGPSSTLGEGDDKPPTNQDTQGQKPPSQAQNQVQEQESPSRVVTQEQATPQAITSRPRTRQQASIEAQAQGSTHIEVQPSPIRASRLFEQPNDEQANGDSEDDGEPLPMQDTHISRE